MRYKNELPKLSVCRDYGDLLMDSGEMDPLTFLDLRW